MVETKGSSKPGEILEIEVACAECGECAAKIALVPPGKKHRKAGSTARGDVGVYDGIGRGDGGSYIVESIIGKCVHAIPAEYVEPMRQVLERKDWAKLYAIDPELVPNWCPKNHPRKVDD